MDKPVRIGLIGCGTVAPTHVQAFARLPDVEVTWACDLAHDRAQTLAAANAIPHVTTDYTELLAAEDVDAVSVCTDHASHAPITVDALHAGKHVLCEKALAATDEGMDDMLAAHGDHPELVFSGVFQHRFNPVNQEIKKLVAEDALGKVLTSGVQMRCQRTNRYYQADTWRGTWAEEGGAVLINQAIHFIDLLLWVTGDVTAVCGTHANLTHNGSMETEDTAVSILRFANGALGTLEATCSSHLPWEPTISIHGTRGSLEVRNESVHKVELADTDRQQDVHERLTKAEQTQATDIAGKTYYGIGHAAQIEDFVSAVRTGRAPYVPAASARRTVGLVLGTYRSHRENRWVHL